MYSYFFKFVSSKERRIRETMFINGDQIRATYLKFLTTLNVFSQQVQDLSKVLDSQKVSKH